MIELYLFIHPLNKQHIELITTTLDAINRSKNHIKFHLIPIADFQIINHYISVSTHSHKIDKRNQLIDTTYQIALDYEVLLSFNQSMALQYYIKIMSEISKKNYSFSLRDQLLESIHCPITRFLHRRQLSIYQDKVNRNHQLMRQMNVTHLPSFIIYNFNQDEDVALLLKDNYDFMLLPKILDNPSFKENYISI